MGISMIPGDGTASGAVAEGIFLINDLPARVLFDSGATHSFVDASFAKYLNLRPSVLFPPMLVSTPLGRSTDLDRVCCGCEVTLDGDDCVFRADLVVMPMKEFDVILGMDWLASYHANIDCFSKTIAIELPNGENLVVATTKGIEFAESFMAFLEGERDMPPISLAKVGKIQQTHNFMQ